MKAIFAKIKEFWHKLFFWHTPIHDHAEFVPETHHDHHLVLEVTSQKQRSRLKQLLFFRRLLDPSEQRIFTVSFLAFFGFLIGGITFLLLPHLSFLPAQGGVVTEGIDGSPKLINPLYANLNDVDRDLSALIYSGLFRLDEHLDPQPDLTERYRWSPDGKILEVTLRRDVFFHDGAPVTAGDVVFTYEAVKGSGWHSPLASNYKNITSIIRVDDQTVQFQLQTPQPTILSDLTLGILPAHLWSDVRDVNATLAELNIKPIGSGPYRVISFTRDNQGAIIKFRLEAFPRYYGFKPQIQEWNFRFFPSRAEALLALKNGQIDSLAFIPWKELAALSLPDIKTIRLRLPQQSIVFFNTKDTLLKDERLRAILTRSIDSQELQSFVGEHATLASSPFPFLSLPMASSTAPVTSTTSTIPLDLDQARQMLDKIGWTLPAGQTIRTQAPPATRTNTPPTRSISSTTSTALVASSTQLALTIKVPDQADLVNLAELIKRRWSLLGIKVTIEASPSDELFDQARAEKDYQIILWNVLVPANQDISKFWNSSDANPGLLNWSNLADRDVDRAIDTLNTATTSAMILSARIRLAQTIMSRFPAMFLLQPTYAYLVNKRILGTEDMRISRPSDRFMQTFHWYVKTSWGWK